MHLEDNTGKKLSIVTLTDISDLVEAGLTYWFYTNTRVIPGPPLGQNFRVGKVRSISWTYTLTNTVVLAQLSAASKSPHKVG